MINNSTNEQKYEKCKQALSLLMNIKINESFNLLKMEKMLRGWLYLFERDVPINQDISLLTPQNKVCSERKF